MFEVHITVNSISKESELNEFVEFCKSIEAKPILIELESGDIAQQPMISKVFKNIEVGQLKNEIEALEFEFMLAEYEVKRVKVEVPLDFIERGKEEFPEYERQGYFEWHGKVEFDDIEYLKESTKNWNAHLSNNSLKGQKNRRFLTVRNYSRYKEDFLRQVDRVKKQLDEKNIKLIKDEYEYCIFDSNKSIDKGWIDTPKITDYEYLKMLAFEGFLRRLENTEAPLILKGSFLTRQCIADKNKRIPKDLDFVYADTIKGNKYPKKIFSKWLRDITEMELDDGIKFNFDEEDIWEQIDYRMNDDYPTISTDVFCEVHGQHSFLDFDITWNLPIEEEPVSLLYKPELGESFLLPFTTPISTQIAWKLHQCVVRPRTKDYLDVILLLQGNNLTGEQLRNIAMVYVNECEKDKFKPHRILAYSKGSVSKYVKKNALMINEKIKTGFVNSPFGIRIGYGMGINHIKSTFNLDEKYESIVEVIKEFEILLKNSGIIEIINELR